MYAQQPAPGAYVPMMAPPQVQMMNADLVGHQAVVIRQVTQFKEAVLQAFGLPFESANKYKISPVPPGVRAATGQDDPKKWEPTNDDLLNAPGFMFAQEESSTCTRIFFACFGCLNLRPFTMKFHDPAGQVRLTLDRPYRCGCGCCHPLMIEAQSGGRALGKAEEDCDPCCGTCVERCFQCIYNTKVLEGNQHRYSIRVPLCCCGPHNNCCGATCCKHHAVFDILDAQGKVVGHIQKLYAPGGVNACCRMANNLNTYILDFPEGSTEDQRKLLLAALMNLNFQLFEKTGDNDS